jgi:nucleoside-diphosphate-sugar epimerase
MKIGVTGAYGFVGGHLLDALTLMSGVEVEPLDRKRHNLFQIESLKPFVENKEVIFHLAGVNRGTKEDLITTNILGTLNLLEAMTAYARNDIRLIYMSSFQVYQMPQKNDPVNEHHPLNPQNIYGISKKTAEEVIASYPFKSIVFRGSNFFGPSCKPYYNSVVSTFCDLVSQNKSLTVHGSGDQGRDFLYISDVIEGLLMTLGYRPLGMEIVNLCSGNLVTVNQIIDMLGEVSGKKIKVEYQDVSERVEDAWCGDNTACREKFNWYPWTEMREGLKLTYQWFERK